MRILFCNKYSRPFSGTEVYLLELMHLLRSHGHEVALFSMANPGEMPALGDYHAPYVDFKSGSTWNKIRLAGHVIYSTEVRHRLREVIADFRPDLAHVRNIYHHLSPSILWEFHSQGIPVLYHVNDFKLVCPNYNLISDGEICNRCRGGNFWHVVSRRCHAGSCAASAVLAAEGYLHKWLNTYRTCVTKILAPSHFAREKLIENGWDQDRIAVLPHFQKLPEPMATPPSDSRIILYFGRLSQEKGLRSLLTAMRNLPSIPLQIAGEGPQEQELRAMAHALQLENVQFLGHLQSDKLNDLLSASYFTIFPSLAYETLGKAILESYAWGRAVIASDLGPRRELVIPGQTGLLYERENSDQLSEAIRFLYTQPELARQMGEAGRELVRERHSPESHYKALLAMYEELAQATAKRSTVDRSPHRVRVAFIGGRGVIGKYSGIESYYEEVGQRLVERGHTVTAYCRTYFTPETAHHDLMRVLRLPCIRTKHLETFSHTILSSMHAAFGPYDIVHFHTLGPALFSFLPRLTGKKTIVTVQGLDWQRKKWGKIARYVLRLGEWAAIAFPDRTMVVSRTLQDYYQSKYGVRPIYIPNGTDIRECDTAEHLNAWHLDPERYVLFMGRFSPEKNCDLLIRAFERVDSPVKLVLAGGAGHSDPYVQALHGKQTDRIRLLNWVSGAARDELLTNAMLFVMPSDLEGLSLALLEAMGAGICVLTSDVAENREVVGTAGFTFRSGDEQDLSRMLQTLISDDELRKASGQRCRERIRANYLWPGITRKIEDQYFEVTGWDQPADSRTQDRSKAA